MREFVVEIVAYFIWSVFSAGDILVTSPGFLGKYRYSAPLSLLYGASMYVPASTTGSIPGTGIIGYSTGTGITVVYRVSVVSCDFTGIIWATGTTQTALQRDHYCNGIS